jgi:hypothetical protein
MERFKHRQSPWQPDISTRTSKRDSLFLLTSLCSPDGHFRTKVRVRNLSATGLMADCPMPIAKGEAVVLDLRGIGPVAGSVIWVQGERIGVLFDQAVDPQQAREPVRKSRSPMPDYLRPVRKIR